MSEALLAAFNRLWRHLRRKAISERGVDDMVEQDLLYLESSSLLPPLPSRVGDPAVTNLSKPYVYPMTGLTSEQLGIGYTQSVSSGEVFWYWYSKASATR